jgi:uncharacterized protein YggE
MFFTSDVVLADLAPQRGSVSVNTTSNIEVAPDTAEISFTVITSDLKSIQKASAINKEIVDKLLVELESLIDKKEGDYIKTADFSVTPIYSYLNSKKIFEKYEVLNKVVVHTKLVSKVGLIIDKAIDSGAINVDNLSFSVSNYEKYCNDLIKTATKNARTRADVVAESLSSYIIGVNNITTSCNANNYNAPRLYYAKNMISDVVSETATGGSHTSISNGVVKINVNVNASFYVK